MDKDSGRILNCEPSRDAQRDWRLEHAHEATPAGARVAPPRKDLRDAWWRIGDQGETGSCVGWATADSVLRWYFVKGGLITPSDVLSPRYVWMAAKESDEFETRPTTFIEAEGTSLKAALDVARKLGVVLDSVLPFRSGVLFAGDARSFYARASRLMISSYFNLSGDTQAWREWLAFEGPLLTRLNVDTVFNQARDTNGRLETYRRDTARGGHAVALVGYDEQGFILRNSWGEGWGDQGFAYASDGYAKAAFTETYGVRL